MIYFKTIRWKNFLSTGNSFTEIKLDRSPNTLIVGENGSGKSTLLDAITYVLFNKPFRNVSKPQLINSINGKKLMVEVEFEIGKNKYLVRRGAIPAVFEIFQNDQKINENANVRDFQKVLEEGILKLNYKSFTQICLLGSASFTPFMQLTPNIRREIIEDILDIQIFTSMNNVLKTKQDDLKERLRFLQTELELAKEKANIQEQYIHTLEGDKKKRVQKLQEEINELTEKVSKTTAVIEATVEQKDTLGNVTEKKDQLAELRSTVGRKLKDTEAELEFYHNNEDCPTCKQGIPHDFKESMTKDKKDKVSELETALNDLETKIAEVDATYEKYLELSDFINEQQSQIISDQRLLQRLHLEVDTTQNEVGDISKEQEKLKTLAKAALKKVGEKSELNEEKTYYDIASSLLKDSGIKTKIIRQYLPAINKLVNKYLSAMDFFVQFDLDETFKETIKSRHRDKFSYASFSEGEKQRIDLALLFTWRTIAKMKNSASTNLLLLDEVFDSSLDNNGTDYVMQLLSTIGDDTHVFVISHKGDQLFDKFRSVIKFDKKQNYSVMT